MADDKWLQDALENAPRIPGVDWSMMLATATLWELDKRNPGFRDTVRERLRSSADRLEASDDPEEVEDAPSMRELVESWVFTTEPSAPEQ